MDLGFLLHVLSGLLGGRILMRTPSAVRYRILGTTWQGLLKVEPFRADLLLAE